MLVAVGFVDQIHSEWGGSPEFQNNLSFIEWLFPVNGEANSEHYQPLQRAEADKIMVNRPWSFSPSDFLRPVQLPVADSAAPTD